MKFRPFKSLLKKLKKFKPRPKKVKAYAKTYTFKLLKIFKFQFYGFIIIMAGIAYFQEFFTNQFWKFLLAPYYLGLFLHFLFLSRFKITSDFVNFMVCIFKACILTGISSGVVSIFLQEKLLTELMLFILIVNWFFFWSVIFILLDIKSYNAKNYRVIIWKDK